MCVCGVMRPPHRIRLETESVSWSSQRQLKWSTARSRRRDEIGGGEKRRERDLRGDKQRQANQKEEERERAQCSRHGDDARRRYDRQCNHHRDGKGAGGRHPDAEAKAVEGRRDVHNNATGRHYE
eukprot:GHVU01142044.1.p3 GENE.GHVU01142044.1~~GHVU01142044.1.p3  ORF type:complete len:125 (+),score=22.19 GHVU01142044.1:213-587(+)